ncbi:MAG: Dihydrolipoamide succinyltransferase component (E2) of 2-oxoglutarate dehydrogenase complex [uncultured Chloroflexi bacterium]|uniref:Dihydrolipoyllysine-residue succinyltransferase component of 2-oxoglutarate dehydrogenase complex n=1 Tax=uncultured Chloroflexota bacterium TaxID=166587 RepID=A0A6J4HKD2_9CHLR|nr:MAG: Dihydrolipoamide succinyltransferase component (E2) of 2-oxoglutarate dehydrogenase complex [uncultured Chloroflexota bacterium]
MAEILVPHLGESVVEATVARWLKGQGDQVQAGEAIVELETEKVNVEVAAEAGGVLEQVLHGEGDTVKVGEALGVIGGGESGGSNGAGQAPAPAPTAAVAMAIPAEPVPTPAASAHTSAEDVSVSPVAARLAVEHGIDPTSVHGSGPGGRVMKEDVLSRVQPPAPGPGAASGARSAGEAPALPAAASALQAASRASAPAGDPLGRPEERVRLTRRRLTIARRLVEAQHTAAMLTTFNEVDMTAVMEIRKRRRDSFKERHGIGLGFMSFFARACVGALKVFPAVNAELQGDDLVLKRYYDLGIAVSTDEGLVVPVVRDADRLTFAEIEKRIGELATRARERKLTIDELTGGTFTITNGGVFGSLLSTPILNPPQVGILGMHKIQERPVAVNGQVVIRPMMYLALSYDHRVIDGREAVTFLVRVKELIEDPEALLLEG